MLKITKSSGKQGVSYEKITYAILRYAVKEEIGDQDGLDAVVFVGPKHPGALEREYIEAVVKDTRRGKFVAFRAKTVSDHCII